MHFKGMCYASGGSYRRQRTASKERFFHLYPFISHLVGLSTTPSQNPLTQSLAILLKASVSFFGFRFVVRGSQPLVAFRKLETVECG